MRQDEKVFFSQAFDHFSGNVLRADGRFPQPVGEDGIRRAVEHRAMDSHRAEDGDADPLIVMRDRQPFGERKGRVFGDSVGRGANLRKQTGGGCGLQEVAVAARDHSGQHGSRGEDVCEDVHFPDAVPIGIRNAHAAGREYAGVGTEEVDAAELLFGVLDDVEDIGIFGDVDLGDVGFHAKSGDFPRNFFGGIAVDISDDDGAGAFFGEAGAKGATDAAGASRDDNRFSGQVHETTVQASVKRFADGRTKCLPA